VASLADFTNNIDRVLINGLVNRIGSASMASSESLRFGVSGRLQTYVLTVVMSIVVLMGILSYLPR
jgi:NAD(P)H-quinone oxidoreductase subunit 5